MHGCSLTLNQGGIKTSVLARRPVPTQHPCLRRPRTHVQHTTFDNITGSHGALQFKLQIMASTKNVSVRGSVKPFNLIELKWGLLEGCSAEDGLVRGLRLVCFWCMQRNEACWGREGRGHGTCGRRHPHRAASLLWAAAVCLCGYRGQGRAAAAPCPAAWLWQHSQQLWQHLHVTAQMLCVCQPRRHQEVPST